MSFAQAVAAARRAAVAPPDAPDLAELTRAVLARVDIGDPLILPRYRELVAAWPRGAPVEAAYPDEPFFRMAAESLLDVLRGEVGPLEAYLAADAPRFLYERSPVARWMNGIVAAAAAELDAPFLEVGAGSGGTTAAVRAALPAGTRYDASDVSPTFVARLAKRGARSFVLDLEAAPAGDYATVVAANVLHATRDLRATLAAVRGLLRPGGTLLVWEATRQQPWFAFTFALIDGWSRHADGLRTDGPLLDGPAWLRLLAAEGWTDAVAIPDDDPLGQRVLMARRPA